MTPNTDRRSERAGILRFGREMTSALVMALIFIVYVIQAFKIPTGSMEDSLLVGDFLLGLKFIYGSPVLPFSYSKFPGITSPKPGDVIIFKYPGAEKKDFIKRCVAGPGQTIETHGKQLLIDGREFVLPPHGKFIYDGRLDPRIADFKPLCIPKRGDLIHPADLDLREFVFFRSLVRQENPTKSVTIDYQLYVNDSMAGMRSIPLEDPFSRQEYNVTFNSIKSRIDSDDWTRIDNSITQIKNAFPGQKVEIRKVIRLDGVPVTEYKVKYDNYFMMGDNRDNSLDSRYWGYLNRNFIKAKAFILYFSLDNDIPWWELPMKIRWNRIGKLIRSWDGLHPPSYYR
ncbi:MAG: signal peptidase I [Chitinispirillaceae bacterium]